MSDPDYSQYPPPPPPPPPHQAASPYSYGTPYPPQPWTAPGEDHTVRNVLLIVGTIVLVVGGLLVWLITSVINTADRIGDELDDAFSTDYPGSESQPLTVDEGEAFTIRGFEYASGWSLGTSTDTLASDLEATNDRPDRDSGRADLRITLLRGTRIVEQFTCYTDATITYGRSAALDCGYATGPLPSYDTIEVNATALFS